MAPLLTFSAADPELWEGPLASVCVRVCVRAHACLCRMHAPNQGAKMEWRRGGEGCAMSNICPPESSDSEVSVEPRERDMERDMES